MYATFQSPYDQYREHNGRTCVVLGVVDPSTYDAEEVGDILRVRFGDGTVIEAWPEEITDAA